MSGVVALKPRLQLALEGGVGAALAVGRQAVVERRAAQGVGDDVEADAARLGHEVEHGAPLEAEGHHRGHPRLRGVAAEGERAVSDDGAVDSLSVAHQEDLRPLETGVGNCA